VQCAPLNPILNQFNPVSNFTFSASKSHFNSKFPSTSIAQVFRRKFFINFSFCHVFYMPCLPHPNTMVVEPDVSALLLPIPTIVHDLEPIPSASSSLISLRFVLMLSSILLLNLPRDFQIRVVFPILATCPDSRSFRFHYLNNKRLTKFVVV